MNKKYIVACLIFFVSFFSSFCEENTQANTSVKKFLDAVKIIDLPEGKKILQKYTWDIERITFPAIISYKKLYSGTFDTDAVGVKGYKQLISLKVSSKGGFELNRKYIVICYRDKISNTWKVFEFRESGNDFEYEAAQSKRDIDENIFDIKLQYKYRHYGYWSMMAGKPSEAKMAFQKAFDINKEDPDTEQYKFGKYLNIINRIL